MKSFSSFFWLLVIHVYHGIQLVDMKFRFQATLKLTVFTSFDWNALWTFLNFTFFFIRVVFNRRNSCFEYLLLQKCKQKPLRWCQLTYKKKIRIKCSTKNYDFFFQAALCAKCLQRHCLPLFRLLIEYLWQGSEHLNLNIDIILASVMRSLFPCLILFYRKQ